MNGNCDFEIIDHAFDEDTNDDVCEDTCEDVGEHSGKRKRGQDIDWKEVARYPDVISWKASVMFKEMDNLTIKKSWNTQYAENETYQCKFAWKENYKQCEHLSMLAFCE